MTIALGVIGCGGQHAVRDDAEVADTAGDGTPIDAPAPDAGAGLVTITVYDDSHVPAPNMPAVFLDASGTVVANTMTDAQGTASAIVSPGASVTAQQPQGSGIAGTRISTYLSVKPGDHLLLGTPVPAPSYTNATLLIPAFGGATSYTVTTSCGPQAGGIATVPLHVTCAAPDLYVRALNNNMSTLGWFYRPAVSVTEGATIDLTAASYAPLANVALEVDNMRTDVGNTFVTSYRAIGGFPFGFELTIASPNNAATRTGTLKVPDVPGGNLGLEVDMYRDNQGGTQRLFDREPFASTYTFDLAAHPVPWMSAALGDPQDHRIVWSETGAGMMDIAFVQLQVIRGTARFTWTVAGPYTPSMLVLPVLPDPLASYNLVAGDSAQSGNYIYVARVPGGWDAVRANVMNTNALFPLLLDNSGAIAYPSIGGVP